MSKTIWIKSIGFQFGAIDGVAHTSIKIEKDGIIRNRRSVVLVGKAESNYPINCYMYIFFCFRILIKNDS